MILAFDCSGPWCAVCVLSDGAVRAAREEAMAKGQAERLFPLVEEALAEAGVGYPDLTAVACGIGPGSFTGLRVAVAAARGLALARGIPAVGVTAFEALYEGRDGPALCAVAAPRGAAFVQEMPDGAPRLLLPEETAAPPEGVVVIVRPGEAEHLTGRRLPPALPVAEAVACAAARRLAAGDPGPRPAPLYLRAADAAPPRHAAPRIVP